VASQLARSAIPTCESHSDSAQSFSIGSALFHSILFTSNENISEKNDREAPDYFGDLNFDQVVEAITAGRDECDLKPFFYCPLKNLEDIYDRQDAFRDLEASSLFEAIQSFADEMRKMRSCTAQSAKYY